ncbi:MAG: hypothetical protein AAF598_01010 [Bacteroidota bacterium]
MTRLITPILVLLFVYSAAGQNDFEVFQTPEDQIVLWQGFQHAWTYNHRINRLGNFVHNQNDQITAVHASATGVGADSTFYSTQFAVLENTDLAHISGKARFVIDYMEKDYMTQQLKVRISLPRGFEGTDQQIALLNGFDLMTLDQADKLHHLHIEMIDVHYNDQENYLALTMRADLMVDCESLECHMFRHLAIYQLDVYFTVLGGTDRQLITHELQVGQNFLWDRKENGKPMVQEHVKSGLHQHYQHAVAGYKSITIELDRAHWFTQLNNQIQNPTYYREPGVFSMSWESAFLEWRPGMRRKSANPKQSMFAMKRRGDCTMQSKLVVLQLEKGDLTYQKTEGALYWPGKNRSPSEDPASLSVVNP